MSACPCGSGNELSQCCEPYIEGTKKPSTAEALMRSRYTAFATGKVDYIEKTVLPEKRGEYDAKATRDWSLNSKWNGFDIRRIEGGGEEDAKGTVEFVATYTMGKKTTNHHEIAEFKKKGDVWYFVDGTTVAQEPFVRDTPKVGRNDPCPCGSGKKYKKCCGRTSASE